MSELAQAMYPQEFEGLSGCPSCGDRIDYAIATAEIGSDSGLDIDGVVWYCESCSCWGLTEREVRDE